MDREEIEYCPFCDSEISIKWDVEKDGYKITCPNCIKKIMLCSACLYREDNSEDDKTQICDWTMENGCFRKRKE